MSFASPYKKKDLLSQGDTVSPKEMTPLKKRRKTSTSPKYTTPTGTPNRTPTGTPISNKQRRPMRELIGQGSTGCIVYPSLAYPRDTNIVGKWIAEKNIAKAEYAISTMLKRYDPDQKYLVYPISMTESDDPPEFYIMDECRPLEKRYNYVIVRKKRQITSPSPTKSGILKSEPFFYELAMARGIQWNYLDMERIPFLSSIANILKGIEIIQLAGYVHQDLEPKNIISINGTSKIIDFSECKHLDKVYNDQNIDKLENLSPIIPPEVLVYIKHIDDVSGFLYRMDISGFQFKKLWMDLHGFNSEQDVKDALKQLSRLRGIDWSSFAKKMDIYAIGTIMLTYISKNKKSKKMCELAKAMTMLDPRERIDVSQTIEYIDDMITRSRSSS